MTTLSVPITAEQEKFIKDQIKAGKAENKAQVVRRALEKLSEEEAINAVLEAGREIRTGNIVHGDIREILKRIK